MFYIVGLIIASTLFGIGTSAMKENGLPFLHFFQSATDIIIRILRVLIWYVKLFFLPVRQNLFYFCGAGKICPARGLRQST